jgi:hypothetical protein
MDNTHTTLSTHYQTLHLTPNLTPNPNPSRTRAKARTRATMQGTQIAFIFLLVIVLLIVGILFIFFTGVVGMVITGCLGDWAERRRQARHARNVARAQEQLNIELQDRAFHDSTAAL